MHADWLSDNLHSRICRFGRSLCGVLAGFAAVTIIALWAGSAQRVGSIALGALPYRDPGRLAAAYNLSPYRRSGKPTPLFFYWQSESKLTDSVAAFQWQWFGAYTETAGPETIAGARVTTNFFSTLGAQPALGRNFLPSENEPGSSRVVILSHEFWRRCFGGDPTAIGTQLSINGEKFAIVGVLPDRFWFLSRQFQIWIPIEFVQARTAGSLGPVTAIARLKPAVSTDQAHQELKQISRRHTMVVFSELVSLPEEILHDIVPVCRFSLYALAVVVLLALLHVIRNRQRIRRALLYAAALVAKCGLALLVVLVAWIAIADPEKLPPGGFTLVLLLAVFYTLCCAAVYWSLLDHRYRCRICLRRLCMPVPTGSWSTPLLDRPGTEYICPYGHGKLNVAEVRLFGMESANWTYYGALWEELVHQETSGSTEPRP